MKTLIVHGRQPEIARAELESIYGPDKMRPSGEVATLLDIEPRQIDFMRLGGMVKFCKVLTVLDTTHWADIEEFLLEAVPQHFAALPEGKLKIGLSVYGLKTDVKAMHSSAIKLKKAGKSSGRSIRIVPNKTPQLNAAQVLHNKLTQKLGWELVFVRDGSKTIVAQSIAVQDIDKYAKRDHGRPCRDARIGMLPPKLAQTIINLAVDSIKQQVASSKQLTILDPFCGTGVVLQEALLTGYDVVGADIDARMVEYSRKNLDWLARIYNLRSRTYNLKVADATTAKWDSFDAIASEVYLGKPLSTLPKPKILDQLTAECDEILQKFLQNVAGQIESGFRMCLAVPAWKTPSGFKHLKILDSLEKLGYNRVKFEHAANKDLIYHRPNQVVARELVTLIRN